MILTIVPLRPAVPVVPADGLAVGDEICWLTAVTHLPLAGIIARTSQFKKGGECTC